MHIGCRRSRDLDIDVMPFAFAGVTGRPHCPRGQIHPSDECRLTGLAGVDQPALLMLTKGSMRPIPADAEACAARGEHLALFGRACESAAIADALLIRTPEDNAHVQTSLDGMIQ